VSPLSIAATVLHLWPGRVAALRACLAAGLLIAPATVRTLAYASPPDPSWIHGIYDDADFDDVVWIAATGAGVTAPATPAVAPPVALAAERPAPSTERASPAPPRSAARPRAPPPPRRFVRLVDV
jgi:hypothetical protein